MKEAAHWRRLREYNMAQAEDLSEVVSQRHLLGSLILTSNQLLVNRSALFPNPVLAEGLWDRLLNSAHLVTMLSRSYRPLQRLSAHQAPNEESVGVGDSLGSGTWQTNCALT